MEVVKKIKELNNKKFDLSVKQKIEILFIIFFIGCVVGWCYEMIFYFVTDKVVINRGVLFGPYLPIYGLGAVLMALFLTKLKNKPILVFLLSILITGVVEYIIGYICVNFYHDKLWDYSGLFLNIDGLVCFRSVFTFAIGGIALIYLIIPIINNIVEKTKGRKIEYVCYFLTLVLIIDIILSYFFRTAPTF